MSLPFTKMHAQGNDFVILDNRDASLPPLDEAIIRRLTERRYGIGCDQLLLLEPSDVADAWMRIFNNDGSEAANCGNGLRCVAAILMQQTRQDAVHIALADRIVQAERHEHGIAVEMGQAVVEDETGAHVDMHVGNRHRVFFEATETFPEDRNIEIITGQVADHIWVDIIERGAGRTLACGSGACATAAAVWHREQHIRPLAIEMPGGCVHISGNMEQIRLTGPVAHVFEGRLPRF